MKSDRIQKIENALRQAHQAREPKMPSARWRSSVLRRIRTESTGRDQSADTGLLFVGRFAAVSCCIALLCAPAFLWLPAGLEQGVASLFTNDPTGFLPALMIPFQP